MELMPIIRPTLPEFREFEDLVRPSWEEGVVTTGRVVRAFEEEVCRQTGAREAVAMNSDLKRSSSDVFGSSPIQSR